MLVERLSDDDVSFSAHTLRAFIPFLIIIIIVRSLPFPPEKGYSYHIYVNHAEKNLKS